MANDRTQQALDLLRQAMGQAQVEFFAPLPFEAALPLLPVRARNRVPPGTQTVILCLLPYYIGEFPHRNLSRYAIVDDYHQVGRALLGQICETLGQAFPQEAFVPFIDASPFDEVRCAVQAGLGVRGKNGMLLNPVYGSYVFIGEIATTLPLPSKVLPLRECPGCGRCQQACPSGALGQDGFHPERCRSHITQTKGALTPQEQEQIRQGGLAWGCDVCNDICPFNRTPRPTPIAAFYEAPEPVLTAEKLPTLLTRKAFAWRGEGVLLRNLHLLEGQPNSQEEEPK